MTRDYFEIVDGYVFRSEAMAGQARKELEGIQFVKKQMDMKNPATVLQVYNRIIDEDLFHTEVGYSFLRQLSIKTNILQALIFWRENLQKKR